jgi:excisionase family DNA binding protein
MKTEAKSVQTQDDKMRLLETGVLNVRQAADMVGQCVASVYAAMERGDLPYIKLGRSRRIPKRALLEWMAANMRGGWVTEGGSAGGGK